MRLGRARDLNGRTLWVSPEGDGFREIDPESCELGPRVEIEKLLAPVEPGKIVAIGLNYSDHAAELGLDRPAEPVIFLKPSTAVIGPDDFIEYPQISERVDFEAELAIVIGRDCRRVTAGQASDYIWGYTCLNDVTARDLQFKDAQWARAKSFDTFCPLGPFIETEVADPDNLLVRSYLNGELKQSSSTANLIFGIFALVSYISDIMTLKRGDVIATGTPAGIGPMQRGDRIMVEIEGVGQLENIVR